MSYMNETPAQAYARRDRLRKTRRQIQAFEHRLSDDVTEKDCTQHGPYQARRMLIFRGGQDVTDKVEEHLPLGQGLTNCPKCNMIWQGEADAMEAALKSGSSAKEMARIQAQTRAGIPARYVKSTVNNWKFTIDQQKRVWFWAEEFTRRFESALDCGRGGVFIGPSGTGKTHLACAIASHVAGQGATVRYCTQNGIMREIRSTYGSKHGATEKSVVDELSRLDLLVVDEVGKATDTEHSMTQFFDIMDNRYNAKKPTILVSNLGRAKIAKFLGEAIMDRMKENGGKVLAFDWVSQRSTKKPVIENEDE